MRPSTERYAAAAAATAAAAAAAAIAIAVVAIAATPPDSTFLTVTSPPAQADT